MKRFRYVILSVLMMLLVLGSMLFYIPRFQDLYIGYFAKMTVPSRVTLSLESTTGYYYTDSLYNVQTAEMVPLAIESVTTSSGAKLAVGETPIVMRVVGAVSGMAGFLVFLFAFDYSYRFMQTVMKKQIFSRECVLWLRKMGAAFLLLFLLDGIVCTLYHRLTSASFSFENYRIEAAPLEYSFLLISVVAFFLGEVFAVALQMKEEQELTI
ncbi:MAG: DUF2975 domain-containing protein [Bacteroides sp.]|nr:DUF2975 domain-containing protein [Bacteroides sp.]